MTLRVAGGQAITGGQLRMCWWGVGVTVWILRMFSATFGVGDVVWMVRGSVQEEWSDGDVSPNCSLLKVS